MEEVTFGLDCISYNCCIFSAHKYTGISDLSAALSMVKVLEMPLGGSVTLLSMLPVCMLSIMYGCKHGLFCAFLFALSQLAVNIGQLAGWG
ncbi:MAG: energy-coupled thiamine transporter ThiT, partial [Ruminococcus sp.]|nr:energy-coupled thiamine transporter ThiT [Ruminococcus sp.]